MSQEKVSPATKPYYLKHDGYFRETFEAQRIAKAFLKKTLPGETLAHLNLDELSIEKRDFKDDVFREKIADVVYRVPIKNSKDSKNSKNHVDFFVVLEHKSFQDYLTIFQLWCYVFFLCRWIFQGEKDKKQVKSGYKLPPVIAIIIHHGRSRFRGKTQLAELFVQIPGLKRFLPKLQAILFDLSDIADDDPILNDPEVPEFRVVLMVLKAVFRKDVAITVREVLEELKPYSDDPVTRRLIRATYIYITNNAKHLKRNYKIIQDTIQKILGGETMPTMVEIWKAEGKAEGRTEDVIRILVRKGNRVSEQLAKRIRAITSIEKLDQLFDLALDCDSLDEFVKNMP